MANVVAPYGGILTRTAEEENAREALLEEQAVNVTVNGETETVRPEAILLRGVDNLSTQNIKHYVDCYLNFEPSTGQNGAGLVNAGTENVVQETTNGEDIEIGDEPMAVVETSEGSNGATNDNVDNTLSKSSFEEPQFLPLPEDQQTKFRVQWINDTSVNIVFKTHEEATRALRCILATHVALEEPVDPQDTIQEREAKPYGPAVRFARQQNLLMRLGLSGDVPEPEQESENNAMEDSVTLYVRQSLKLDVKVSNARAQLRYYLLHGEPERRKRPAPRKREPANRGEEEDLFASRMCGGKRGDGGRDGRRGGSRDERRRLRSPRRRLRSPRREPDLFADRMR